MPKFLFCWKEVDFALDALFLMASSTTTPHAMGEGLAFGLPLFRSRGLTRRPDGPLPRSPLVSHFDFGSRQRLFGYISRSPSLHPSSTTSGRSLLFFFLNEYVRSLNSFSRSWSGTRCLGDRLRPPLHSPPGSISFLMRHFPLLVPPRGSNFFDPKPQQGAPFRSRGFFLFPHIHASPASFLTRAFRRLRAFSRRYRFLSTPESLITFFFGVDF